MLASPLRRLALGGVAALSCLCAPLSALEAEPTPLAWPDGGSLGVLGTAMAPSLDGLITGIAAASAATGQAMPPAAIRQQLGGSLGDPNLENIRTDVPITAVFTTGMAPMGAPGYAILIPAKDPAALQGNAQMVAGEGIAQVVGDLLVIADQQATIDALGDAKAGYEALSATPVSRHLQIDLDLAGIYNLYGPMAQASMGMLPMMLMQGGGDAQQMQAMTALMPYVQAGAVSALHLWEQCHSLTLSVSLSEVPEIDSVLRATDGSKLAGAMSAPAESDLQSIGGLVDPEATMAGLWAINIDGWTAAMQDLMDRLGNDPNTANLVTEDLRGLLDQWGSVMGSRQAFSADMTSPQNFAGTFAYSVNDAAAALDMLESSYRLVDEGSMADLYKGMGLEPDANVEKNVRQVGDVSIHRATMEMKPKEGTDPQMANATSSSFDIATIDGWLLGSAGDTASIEALILRAQDPQPGTPLASQSRFGNDLHGYFDYDIAALFSSMGMFGDLPESEPMMMGTYAEEGRQRFLMALPLEAFAAMNGGGQPQGGQQGGGNDDEALLP